MITTVAGTGRVGFSGYGGPATSAPVTPFSVAVDASGNLVIADSDNHRRIRIVTKSTGIITTVAGTGGIGISGDGGPATSASLFSSSDVVIDASENIFIAD